jgi:GNAT superfamily N-acetyltransferase
VADTIVSLPEQHRSALIIYRARELADTVPAGRELRVLREVLALPPGGVGSVGVLIERATPADIEVISVILGEIESYYGGKDVPGDQAQIGAALFGERPVATVLLARDGDDVLGLASYSVLWPAAGAESSVYLKELYVRAPHRRRGVARALLEQAARGGDGGRVRAGGMDGGPGQPAGARVCTRGWGSRSTRGRRSTAGTREQPVGPAATLIGMPTLPPMGPARPSSAEINQQIRRLSDGRVGVDRGRAAKSWPG